MDGSSKFVRGDAVAAVVITLVNILGGLTIGVLQQGMTVAAAAQTYTLLTVGEGLVAQVPALIVSTAGRYRDHPRSLWRSTSVRNHRQVLISPKAIGTLPGILLAMGLVPGIAPSGLSGARQFDRLDGFNSMNQKTAVQLPNRNPRRSKPRKPPPRSCRWISWKSRWDTDSSVWSMEDRVAPCSTGSKGLRRQFAEQMGFVLPPIHIRDNLQLGPMVCRPSSRGVELVKSEVMPAHVLAIDQGPLNVESFMGCRPKNLRSDSRPGFRSNSVNRRRWPDIPWWILVPPSHICRSSSSGMRMSCWDGRKCRALDQLGKNHPKLVEEVIPNLIPLGTLVACCRISCEKVCPFATCERFGNHRRPCGEHQRRGYSHGSRASGPGTDDYEAISRAGWIITDHRTRPAPGSHLADRANAVGREINGSPIPGGTETAQCIEAGRGTDGRAWDINR